MIGDDSCYAAKLEDANDAIDQSASKNFDDIDDHRGVDAFCRQLETSSVVENGLSDGEDQFPSIVEKSVASSESAVPSNDLAAAASDREVPAFSEKRDSSYEFPSLDPNDEVVSHHMTGFADASQTNSMIFCGTHDLATPNNGQPFEQDAELFSFRDEKSDVSEKSQPSFAANNPFAGEHREKETFEEKELDAADKDETDLLRATDLDAPQNPTNELQFGKQEVPDLTHDLISPSSHKNEFTDSFCHFRPSKEQSHPFDDDSKEPISLFQTTPVPHPTSNGIEELVCIQEESHVDVEAPVPVDKVEHVEVHVERPASPANEEFVEKHEAPEKPDDSMKHISELSGPQADSSDQFVRQLSEQIVDLSDYTPRQFSAEECDRLEDVTVLSDSGDPDEPIVSVDVEAPYIHDCGRLDEKPGSVHHHTTHTKHYTDLLPDVTSTMESDKLESELRESEAKVEPEPVPLIELPAKADDIPVAAVEEAPKSDNTEVTTQPSAVAVAVTASAVTAAAVATVGVAATAISDTKKAASVIKKPEGAAKPSKPTPKPSTMSTKARPAAPKLDTKKPTVSSTMTKLTSSRTAAPPRPAAPAKTAPAARTLAAAKPSLSTTKTTPSSSTPKPPVKLSSPAKPKMTTAPTTSTTKVMANGDVSKAPARKPLASSSTLRKPLVEGKPAVTMSNRVSLAPKVPRTSAGSSTATKGEPAVTASRVSSSLAAPRRPISAPTKVTQKDTKDIANKRLSSAAKSSPTKASATNGKTESKVNSLSKSAPKTTSSSTTSTKPPSPIKRPVAAAVSSPSQSNPVDHQN